MNFTNFYLVIINYYLVCPICKKGKNYKISYDAFDENGYCLLRESTKKNYSFLCCNRINFINFDVAFNKETSDVFEISIEIFNALKTFNLKQ